MKLMTRKFTWLAGATALTIAGMFEHNVVPGAGIVALAGLLTLPGILSMLIIRPEKLSTSERVVFTGMLSIIVLMLSGFVSNQLVPHLGNPRPLTSAVQVPWTSMLLGGLWLGAWWRNRKQPAAVRGHRLTPREIGLAAALLVIPAMAALGADSLNNGGTNVFTMVAYALVAGWAVALVAQYKRVTPWLWGWSIFVMGLALLWSTSLRSLYISGHDVQLEYYVARLTDLAQHWSMANLQDAYNACLSITVLPTVLKDLTGVGAMALYKIVYQIMFALAGVGLLGLSRRIYPSSAVAFVSAFIFIAFPTFVTDMPFLNRQEIAFLFFIGLLMAVLNHSLSARTRRILSALMVAGLVLSHYSTTFVTLAVIGGTYELLSLLRIWRNVRLSNRAEVPRWPSQITFGLVAVMIVATFVWTDVYTKTGNNISTTLGNVAKALPTILSAKDSNDSNTYTLLKTKHPSPQTLLDTYVAGQAVKEQAAAAHQGGTYTDWKAYPVRTIAQPVEELTSLGKWMQSLKLPTGLITTLGKQGYALLLQAGILLGGVIAIVYRRHFNLDMDFVALAPVGIGLVAFQAVMPVIDYGLFRMLQQDLVFLALPVTLGAMKLLGFLRLRSKQARLTVITAVMAACFLITSGFVGALTGGTNQQLALANNGFYYDAYYTDAQDMATFTWLEGNYQTGYPINSDTFTRMKIMANTGIVTVDGVTPGEISKQSYVVLTGANVTADRVAMYVPANGSLLDYTLPMSFFDNDKNLIYATNATRVYH